MYFFTKLLPQIQITKKVKEKLDQLKDDLGAQTYNEIVNILIEKYKTEKKTREKG